ncbi:type IV secretion system protein [Asticcacaulis tiandongensis]|uniref:type IV secretion system protein n=1 Tax=Asticcacaulis tiandongensis TaxID=2565365 RepID=UPI00112877D6|nr:type IV secretion system protein [Asticcacaulis tiandongensis]
MSNCPPITLVGETSVSGSLRAMDCQIGEAVATGYNRLFGAGGAFSYALTLLLIIYVALLAYGFLTGRTRLTLPMMSPRIITMVLVLVFVSFWPFYNAIFYGLLMGGPDQIAAALLGQKGSAVMNFAERLDALFVRFAEIAQSLETVQNQADGQQTGFLAAKSMPVTLFWLSGLFLLFSTLGVLILSRMVLNLLLILGPIFIVMALFGQTRGLFNGWLRTSVVFALAPMLAVLGGTTALSLFIPLIDFIAEDPMRSVRMVQPMVILFMGSLIYAAFLAVLMWVAGSLVRDWQAALRDKTSSDRQTQEAQTLSAFVAAGQAAQTVAATAEGSTDRRSDTLVTAIDRENASAASRESGERLVFTEGGTAPATATPRRTQGLGQRFRSANRPATTTVTKPLSSS